MYKNIVVLTGAGISAESGIPVFRSETGLWEQERVEDVATYEGFLKNKTKVHDFYNKMRQSIKSKTPNQAHLALTRLQSEIQKRYGGVVSIVTQNIDDLHEKAGSKDIIHMHGELNSILCESCQSRVEFFDNSSVDSVCPVCGKKSLRPDIVWFGEIPYQMEKIEKLLCQCDLFLSIGTSGVVYPAAGFCHVAKSCGATCVEFNLEQSNVATQFHYGLYEKASVSVPAFVEHLIEHNELLKEI